MPCEHASIQQWVNKSLIFRSFWMDLDCKVASILGLWIKALQTLERVSRIKTHENIFNAPSGAGKKM
jgi:hypothetical protein